MSSTDSREGPPGLGLDAHVVRAIHPGLQLDATLQLGAQCGVIFGPSGAGKTSLLRAIAGLERPERGRIQLGDQVLFDSGARIDRPLRQRRLGMIFQDDLLFPHLDVAGNIRFGLQGWPRAEAAARLAAVAALCAVTHLLGRRPEHLSGGERQRVGLARALAPRPRLLLCDEPVSALDLEARSALVQRLRAVQRTEQIPLLYVTHSPDEAIALGDRLFGLQAGQIVAQGTPLEVLAASGRLRGPGSDLHAILNRFDAVILAHDPGAGETALRLGGPDGPTLFVPLQPWPLGSAVQVTVGSDEVLLAVGPLSGPLSARNAIEGQVERLIAHGPEVEVVVRTGPILWMASLMQRSVRSLELAPGVAVTVILKARSPQLTGG